MKQFISRLWLAMKNLGNNGTVRINQLVKCGVIAVCGMVTTCVIPAGAQIPLSGISQVVTGFSHTCALTMSGGVKCWGDNERGQLGVGDIAARYLTTATDVIGLQSGVISVVTGSKHSCALLNTGGVKCWGNNDAGQLGDNTWQYRWAPVDVVGLISGVTAIAAGANQTCALTNAGGVKCWGYNNFTYHQTAVDISGLTSGVVGVTAGANHLCALTSAGGVKCWGDNIAGQLGNGTTLSQSTAVDVIDLTSGVIKVDAGYNHTCAILNTGGVKCWGYNLRGQLGNNTTTQSLIPVDVLNLASNVTTIAVGASNTCALTNNGGVKCWGSNDSGQLGINSTTSSLVPVDVVELVSGVTSIDTNMAHSCAVTDTQEVKCWGDNSYGRVGDGSTLQRLTPAPGNIVNGNLPNNCTSSPISFGVARNGSWGEVNDCIGGIRGPEFKTDSYSFAGQAGQRVSIQLTSGSFNTFAYLRDSNGLVIASDDDGGGTLIQNQSSNSRIPANWGFFTLPVSGTYLIEVTSSSSTNSVGQGAYSLLLTLNGSGAPSSSSSSSSSVNSCSAVSLNNFGTAYAGTLTTNDCISGARGTNYYTDRYSFSGTPGQLVAIQLSGSFDTYVYLKNPSGTVIASNDDGGGGSNSRIPATSGNFTIPAGATGQYVIEVTSYSTLATGTYSLTVTSAAVTSSSSSLAAGSSSSNVSSNSSSSSVSSSASSVSPCNVVVAAVSGVTSNGTLATTDCTAGVRGASYYTDRYSFSGVSGQQISIQLTSGAFDSYLYLKNSSGTVISSNDDGGGGTNSRIPATSGSFILPATGTYVIEVTSYSTLRTGAYSLLLAQ